MIPLLVALHSPRVVYTTVLSDETTQAAESTSTTSLLQPNSQLHASTGLSPVSGKAGDLSKYGTFRAARPTPPGSNPLTRSTTPALSNIPDRKVCRIVLTAIVPHAITSNLNR